LASYQTLIDNVWSTYETTIGVLSIEEAKRLIDDNIGTFSEHPD